MIRVISTFNLKQKSLGVNDLFWVFFGGLLSMGFSGGYVPLEMGVVRELCAHSVDHPTARMGTIVAPAEYVSQFW